MPSTYNSSEKNLAYRFGTSVKVAKTQTIMKSNPLSDFYNFFLTTAGSCHANPESAMLTSDVSIQHNIQIRVMFALVRRNRKDAGEHHHDQSSRRSQSLQSLLTESRTSASAVGVRGVMIHLKGTGCLLRKSDFSVVCT